MSVTSDTDEQVLQDRARILAGQSFVTELESQSGELYQSVLFGDQSFVIRSDEIIEVVKAKLQSLPPGCQRGMYVANYRGQVIAVSCAISATGNSNTGEECCILVAKTSAGSMGFAIDGLGEELILSAADLDESSEQFVGDIATPLVDRDRRFAVIDLAATLELLLNHSYTKQR